MCECMNMCVRVHEYVSKRAGRESEASSTGSNIHNSSTELVLN